MRFLILTLMLLIASCSHHKQEPATAAIKSQRLSHAGFYEFYLDAPAGEIRTWKNKQLFESIIFSGLTTNIKFFDIFPHEKWLSGLRLTFLNNSNNQEGVATIDLFMNKENNRIALTVKPANNMDALTQDHTFFLDEYIQMQIFIDQTNQIDAIINGKSESLQLGYRPSSIQLDAIGSDTHITLDIYEQK